MLARVQLRERIEVIQQTGTLDQQSLVAGNDVTVIGGGLAGMAASIHLAKAGLRVLCVGACGIENDAIGESLDWSAPGLLADLGLTMTADRGKNCDLQAPRHPETGGWVRPKLYPG